MSDESTSRPTPQDMSKLRILEVYFLHPNEHGDMVEKKVPMADEAIVLEDDEELVIQDGTLLVLKPSRKTGRMKVKKQYGSEDGTSFVTGAFVGYLH